MLPFGYNELTEVEIYRFTDYDFFAVGFVIVGDDKSNLENIKTIKYSGKSKKIAAELITQF